MSWRILLVENDPLDQLSFTRFFKKQKLPYKLEIAESVASAMALLQKKDFDVAIIDYMLDDGSGFDVLEAIDPDIPTILITGTGSEKTAVKALRLGASDYLIKDVDRSYLALIPTVIERAIRSKREESNIRMLSQALNSSHESIFITNLENQIIYANRAFQAMYGFDYEEIIGFPCADLFHPLSKRRPGEKGLDFEHIHLRKDNSSFPVSLSRSDVQNDQGRTIAHVVICRDLTEKKIQEARKFQLLAEKRRTQILQKFIQDASHDLKTPLSALSVGLYILKKEADGQFNKRIDMLERQTKRLISLVNDLLQMSTLDGQEFLETQSVSPQQILENVVLTYQLLALEKEQKIRIECETGNFRVLVDSNLMTQALANVIINAIAYTPEGGEILVKFEEKNEQAIILVEDNGIGIGDKHIDKIFDRFYRVDPSRNTRAGGSGLGLAITKKIVELHAGQISVLSVEGQGSNFIIQLPLYLEQPIQEPQPILV